MRCLFVMADAQSFVWCITLQTPLQESEDRPDAIYGHGTGGDLRFPMIQEKITPGATMSL